MFKTGRTRSKVLEHSLYSYAGILLSTEAPGSRKLIFCITRPGFTPGQPSVGALFTVTLRPVGRKGYGSGGSSSESVSRIKLCRLHRRWLGLWFENENNLEWWAQQRARSVARPLDLRPGRRSGLPKPPHAWTSKRTFWILHRERCEIITSYGS